MNNIGIKLSFFFVFLTLFLVTGCAENDLVGSVENDDDAQFLESVGAVFANSKTDDIEIPDLDPEDHTDNYEATLLLDDGFHNLTDTLFFSQLVSGKLVPFQGVKAEDFPPTMPENMREKFKNGYPNLYRYYYKDEYTSTWEDDPGGYNFFPTDTIVKMNWDDVKFWGLNNTGYALYALFYPYSNQLPIDENGNFDFKVETDQTSKDALRKSNFLGAYHSSSKSGQRLKFKLYHLTSYLKVTLYVPVYNPHDTIVNDKGVKEEVRSGYPADALQSAEVRGIYNHFRINWYGGRSSDTSPLVVVNTEAANPEYTRQDVSMFIPQPEDYPDTEGLPPKVTINLADYVRDWAAMDLPETDECWQITLSALIPAGQDYPKGDETYPDGQTWTDLNFLRFNMRQNIGSVPKRYVFTGNSSSGLIGSGDNITIGQGRIQELSLYLPRYGAKAVLLGANVEDWEQWYNDNMGLRKEEPIEPEDPAEPDPEDPEEPDDNTDPTDTAD